MRRFGLAFIIAALFAAGCQDEQMSGRGFHRERMAGNYSNPMVYMKELPAVKDVDIWRNDFGKGYLITTKHYEIYTTLNEPLMLRQVPAFMEASHRAYQNMVPGNISTSSKFKVYLFATREQWEAFTRNFTGIHADVYMKIQRGAYYLNGSCVAYNIGRTRTFAVLGHESWHQFNSRHFKYRLPSWLDEGIAMYFETGKYNDGRFEFNPTENLNRLGSLKYAMMQNKLIGLEQLIMLNPGEVLMHGSGDATLSFYAQAYALVRFLRESNHAKRYYQFNSMLGDGLSGRWPLTKEAANLSANRNIPMTARYNSMVAKAIFENYIGNNYDELESEYLRFCKKITGRITLSGGYDGK